MKNYFPLSFKYSKGLIDMLVGIIVYLIIAAIAGVLIWVAGMLIDWIPVAGEVLGLILKIVSIVVEAYVLVGIVLLVLAFLKIVK